MLLSEHFCVIQKDHFFFFFSQHCTAWRELTSAYLPSPLLHTRSLCVCSASENEGRPWRTITTKHIPFCPTAPPAQTQTQRLYVYQASHGKTTDLGPLLRSLKPSFSSQITLNEKDLKRWLKNQHSKSDILDKCQARPLPNPGRGRLTRVDRTGPLELDPDELCWFYKRPPVTGSDKTQQEEGLKESWRVQERKIERDKDIERLRERESESASTHLNPKTIFWLKPYPPHLALLKGGLWLVPWLTLYPTLFLL